MEEIIHFSEDKLPPLHLSQFEGKLKKSHQPLQKQGQKQAPTGVYTVFESLQDEYVVKNLELDLGSLNQFIDLRSADPNPILPNLRNRTKKSKKEIKDNEHELFLKKVNVQQIQLTPFEILKYEDDEKKRGQAAKDIVHMIFRKIYGEDIDKFEEKNSRQVLQQKYLEGDDVDNPMITELKFIKKHIKKTLPERFDIFEKQLQQQKNQPQPSLKLKVVSPLEHQSSKIIKVKQGESAAKQRSDKSSDEKSPQSRERKITESHIGNKSEVVLMPLKKSFFGAGFTQQIEEEPLQDQAKMKQKRLEILFKLKAQCMEVNNLWATYWGNNKGLLHIKEYLEIQKGQNLDIAKFFSHQEKFQNKFRALISTEFKEEIKESTEEIVLIDPGCMIVMRNLEVTPEMVLYLAINTGHWGTVRHFEFYNTKLNEPAMKILLSIVKKECTSIVNLNFSKNKLSRTVSKMLLEVLYIQKKLARLRLSHVGMDTKEFVEICLAICEVEIKDIDFSDNIIDKRGLKALETLLRYVKSLNSVDLSGNQFVEDNEEDKAKLFRQLRKIIIYNAGLKNKNIKI